MRDDRTLYEAVGGMTFFRRLVDLFYDGVEGDAVLLALYPEQDLAPARERLTLFLGQYWGGPDTYSQRRGHPMLRRRHVAFHIDEPARDRWLHHMDVAITALGPPPEVATALREYFVLAADAMVNQPSSP